MKPSAGTPLVDGPDRKARTSSATLLSHAVLCVIVPTSCYMTLVGTSYKWFTTEDLTQAFMVVAVLLVIFSIVLSLQLSRKAWFRQLGNLCLLTLMLAVLACMWNEFEHMVYYRTYSAMRLYTNVQPTVPAVRYLDAGRVEFSADASVDKTRGRAFKSFEKPGMTFCVAPIVDSTLGQADEIGFWAVGDNCCAKMATFACDDAGDGSVKSAVVLLPPNEVLPEWVLGLGLGDNHYDDYLQALKLSSATFGVVQAKDVRLMKWIKSPEEYIDHFSNDALSFWIETSALLVGLLTFAVGYLVMHGLLV